jgi:DNA-directed RNA polymerase specialized sigma24 family protein
MDEEEAELVHGARGGDALCFEKLVRLTQGRIRAWFATRLSDASLVDDLAQDVFFVVRHVPLIGLGGSAVHIIFV